MDSCWSNRWSNGGESGGRSRQEARGITKGLPTETGAMGVPVSRALDREPELPLKSPHTTARESQRSVCSVYTKDRWMTSYLRYRRRGQTREKAKGKQGTICEMEKQVGQRRNEWGPWERPYS